MGEKTETALQSEANAVAEVDTDPAAGEAAKEAAHEAAYAARRKRAHDGFVSRGLERLRQALRNDASIHSVAEAIFRHLLEDQPRDEPEPEVDTVTQQLEQVDGEGSKNVPQAGEG